MKATTKTALFEAWQFCDDEDKSTEFMLQYMQDFAGVDLDCVLNFIEKNSNNRPKPPQIGFTEDSLPVKMLSAARESREFEALLLEWESDEREVMEQELAELISALEVLRTYKFNQ